VTTEQVDLTVANGAVGFLFDNAAIASHVATGKPLTATDARLTLYPDPTRSQTAVALLAGLNGQFLDSNTRHYKMIVAGDVNGDGLDDVVLLNSDYYATVGATVPASVGRAYVFLAGQTSAAAVSLDQAHTVYEDVGIDGLAALGDLNGDGYADFAITRLDEDSGLQSGSVLGFYGASLLTPGVLRAGPAANFVVQRTALIPAGSVIAGPIYVTAGDFSGDGKMDLAVGSPTSQEGRLGTSTVFGQQNQGQVSVFWDVADQVKTNRTLFLDQADVTVNGVGPSDELGTLPATPGYEVNGSGRNSTQGFDLNGDGVDDLLIGAATADTTTGGFTRAGGKVYVIYGDRFHNALPTGATQIFTSPTGNFLADQGSGAITEQGSGYNLAAGQQQQWYQFTTDGDGQAGNQIAVGPAYQPQTTTTMAAADETLLGNGTVSTTAYGVADVGASLGNSVVVGVNNAGQAAGTTSDAQGGHEFAFVWQQGVMIALPSLGNPLGTSAAAINQSGQVVGQAEDIHGVSHAVLWTPDPTQPGTWLLKDLGKNLVATALNDAGQVVGYENLPTGGTQAFLWEGGQITLLNNADGGTLQQATGINNHGQVVGFTLAIDHQTFTPVEHAYLWQNGHSIDLGALMPGGNSHATAINDAGQVAGFADVIQPTGQAGTHAFLWTDSNHNGISDPGEMVDLGTLGGFNSKAFGINQLGQVTGTSDTVTGGSHAFITRQNVMVDLSTLTGNNSPFTAFGLGAGNAVSPSGNVLGGSARTNSGGQTHGFVATPVLTVGGSAGSQAVFDIDLADLLPHLDDTVPGIPAQVSPFSAIQQALLNLDVLGSTLAPGDTVQVFELTGKGTGDLTTDLKGSGTIGPNGGPGAPTDSLIANYTASGQEASQGLISIDLTSAIRQALLAGKTRVVLEVSTASRGELQVYPTEAGNGHRTGLSVTTAAQTGVLADLYDAHGGLLAGGQSILDLRNEPAGTYYLRVYNPAGPGTAALPFTLTINAPTPGNAQPVPERSVLDGGDGNDILVAGTASYSLDRLYGDGGANQYVGEGVEIKDASSLGNPLVMGQALEHVFNIQPFQFADQVVKFTDPALALALAGALGLPVTQAQGGQPLIARAVLASELAGLTQFLAAGQGITNLSGLQFATNLSQLDLTDDQLLSDSVQSVLSSLTHLHDLDLSDTFLTDISFLASPKVATLRSLVLDGNFSPFGVGLPGIPDLSPLADLTNLEFLSVDALSASATAIKGVSTLVGLSKLQYLSLRNQGVSDLSSLAGQQIIDNGDPGYHEVGGKWTGGPNANAYNGNYRLQAGDGTTTEVSSEFTGLTPGTYDVYATWPADPTRSQEVVYTADTGSQVFGANNFAFFTPNGLPDVGNVTTTGPNPFLVNNAPTANLPGLTISPAPYGLLAGVDAQNSSTDANNIINAAVFNAAPGALAALLRVPFVPNPFNLSFEGYDLVLFVNLSGSALASPELGTDSLLTALPGLANNVLPAYAIYATLVPSGEARLNFGAQGDIASADLQEDQLTYLTPAPAGTPVNQALEPTGAMLGGRPWQQVGQVTVTSGGTLRVELTNAGSGNFAADAVRVVRTALVLPDLKVLDVTGGPLNNTSLAVWVPYLQQQPVQVNYTAERGHITFAPIGPQAPNSNGFFSLPLTATDSDGDPIVFTVQANDPRLSVSISSVTGAPTLQAIVPFGVTGTVQITVTAHDAKSGRTAQQTFPLLVGSGAITGTVFNDNNANGVLDAGEAGMEGQVVYLDRNNDGVLDSGDQSTVSDAQGDYTFTGLTPGIYIVREDGGPMWLQTTVGTPYLAADILAGASPSFPTNLSTYNGDLYFMAAADKQGDSGLFRFDGVTASEVTGPSGHLASNSPVIPLKGAAYFSAQGRLWRLASGAVSEVLTPTGGRFSGVSDLTVFNGSLYFAADGGDGDKNQLWTFDGNSATRVTALDTSGDGADPFNLTVADGSLFFAAYLNSQALVTGAYRYDGHSVTEITAQDGSHLGEAADFTASHGAVYFSANGAELWQYPGGTTATEVAPSAGGDFSGVSNLTALNGTLYFAADGDSAGAQVWHFDGTSASRVTNLNAAGGDAAPDQFTALNGVLYFTAAVDSQGEAGLFRLDGTTPTEIVSSQGGHLAASGLTVFNNSLVFGADGGDGTGNELWQYDGFGTQATRLADINAGSGGSFPSGFTAFNGTLYFSADNGSAGTELFGYAPATYAISVPGPTATVAGGRNFGNLQGVDAGPDQTVLRNNPVTLTASVNTKLPPGAFTFSWQVTKDNQVVQLDPSTTQGQSFTFTPAAEGVYFVTVAMTDPSLGGRQFTDTVQVDSQEGVPAVNPGLDQNVAEGGTVNLSSGFSPSTTPHTTQWTVTQNATYLADDLILGQGGSNPTGLTAFNGKLYFAADGDGAGTQLWQFDGHRASRLTDFDPADGGGSPANLAVAGGSLFFTAYLDVKLLVSGLFRYDGSSVTEVTAPGGGHLVGVSELTSFNGDLIVNAGGMLWQFDGTQLTEITPSPGGHFSGASGFTALGPALYFIADGGGGTGSQLWQLDGTQVARVTDLPALVTGVSSGALGVYDNSVYFTAYLDTQLDTGLFRLTGGAVTEITAPGNRHLAFASTFIVNRGDLYFSADAGDGAGTQLWQFDGTTSARLTDLQATGSGTVISSVASLNGSLYCTAYRDGSFDNGLYRYDGTSLTEVTTAPGGHLNVASDLVVFNDSLVFAADGGDGAGTELWQFDGSAASRLADINRGSNGSFIVDLTAVNGLVYFQADDSVHGAELWAYNPANSSAPVAHGSGDSFTFTPPHTGSYTATVTGTDDDGVTATGSALVTVTNVAPTAALVTVTSPQQTGVGPTADEGDLVQLHGTFTDPGLGHGGTFTYDWHVVSSNGQVIANGTGQDFSFTANASGTYTATFTVTDQGGATAISSPTAITVLNVPPQHVSAGTSQTVNEGDTVTLHGTYTDPGIGTGTDSFTYDWHVVSTNGQLIADGTGQDFSFVADASGTYTATFTVTDKDGASTASSTVTITSVNMPPRNVSAGPDQTVNEGDTVTLLGTFTDPGIATGADHFTYLWHVTNDNGQVIPDGSGQPFSFVPSTIGTYHAMFTVTDSDGASSSATAVVTAQTSPLEASAGQDQQVDEGSPVSLHGTFTDAGTANTHTYLWSAVSDNGQVVSDGTAQDFGFTPDKVGTYLVTFTVSDNLGDAASSEVLVTTLNAQVQDVGVSGPTTPVNAGDTVTLHGTFTDPGDSDPHLFHWHVVSSNGQAVADVTTQDLIFQPQGTGTYTATFDVTKNGVTTFSSPFVVTAQAAAPTVSLAPVIDAGTRGQLSATASFTEPGALVGPWEVAINYGDGTTFQFSVAAPSTFAIRHTYTGAGSYPLTVSVTNGEQMSATAASVVRAAPPAVTLSPSSASAVFGQGVTFTATVATSPAPTTPLQPTGSIHFQVDGVNFGQPVGLTAVNGVATAVLTVGTLSPAMHGITALYAGDTDFLAGSATAAYTVAADTTTTALNAAANPSVWGEPLTLTATVAANQPGVGTPTGQVTFLEGTRVLGTGTLQVVNGLDQATFVTSALVPGTQPLTSVYAGDSNFVGGSVTVMQTVSNSAVALTAASGVVPLGSSVILTAKVGPVSGTGVPTGTVTILDGSQVLAANVRLTGGTATFNTKTLTTGVHTLSVVYNGDSAFTRSISAPLSLIVQNTAVATNWSLLKTNYGQAVTFTAAVSALGNASARPGGTVTFFDGTTPLMTLKLPATGANQVSFAPTTPLAVGSHLISAAYSGDPNNNFSSTSSGSAVTVVPGQSNVQVSAPSKFILGQLVTLTATVSAALTVPAVPTGTVTFRDGSLVLGTATLQTVSGTAEATLVTSALPAGTTSVTTAYAGDTNFTSSKSANVQVTASADNTKTVATSSPANSPWGQAVTITATVSGLTSGPAGAVTFLDGNTPLATVQLGAITNGAATAAYTTSSLGVGTHSINAAYGGINTLTPSAGTVKQTIIQAKTTATLRPVANSDFGQPATFTATVAAATGAGTPSGTVTFKDGTSTLGTGTLHVVNGTDQASFMPTVPLSAGPHSITAVYNGDVNFSASPASPKLALTVSPAQTATVVTSSLSPANAGQAVTLTATVSSAAGTPGGSVSFTTGSTVLQKGVPLVNGVATLTTPKLAASGTAYTILATYSASGNFGPSSGTVAQTVNPDQMTATSTVLVQLTSSSRVFGQPVTFTAQVAPAPGLGVPTGTVTFRDGSSTLGSAAVQVVGGVAQASLSLTAALAAGAHSITAVYNGDGNFKSSTSAAQALTVNPAATTTILTSLAETQLAGQAEMYLIVVTPVAPAAGAPDGTVTVYDGATKLGTVTLKLVSGLETGTLTLSALSIGVHSLSAVFVPAVSQTYSASTSAVLTQLVVPSFTSPPTGPGGNSSPNNLSAAALKNSAESTSPSGGQGKLADPLYQFWTQWGQEGPTDVDFLLAPSSHGSPTNGLNLELWDALLAAQDEGPESPLIRAENG
jgi:probable HAF family extracellular repeat protein/ELWxxDGT repeat protein